MGGGGGRRKEVDVVEILWEGGVVWGADGTVEMGGGVFGGGEMEVEGLAHFEDVEEAHLEVWRGVVGGWLRLESGADADVVTRDHGRAMVRPVESIRQCYSRRRRCLIIMQSAET